MHEEIFTLYAHHIQRLHKNKTYIHKFYRYNYVGYSFIVGPTRFGAIETIPAHEAQSATLYLPTVLESDRQAFTKHTRRI